MASRRGRGCGTRSSAPGSGGPPSSARRSPSPAPAGEAVFRGMLAVPGLFDAVHFAALRTGSRLALLADAAARRRLVPRLRAYLDSSPAHLAVSVFATGASAGSRLADPHPAMSHVGVVPHPQPHR